MKNQIQKWYYGLRNTVFCSNRYKSGISGGAGISDKCFFGRKSVLFFFCSFAVAPSPTLAGSVIISLPSALKRLLVVVYVLLVRVFLLLLLAKIEKIPPEMQIIFSKHNLKSSI